MPTLRFAIVALGLSTALGVAETCLYLSVTRPKNKHSRATVQAWRDWGKRYTARTGKVYVPPKKIDPRPFTLTISCDPLDLISTSLKYTIPPVDYPLLQTDFGFEPMFGPGPGASPSKRVRPADALVGTPLIALLPDHHKTLEPIRTGPLGPTRPIGPAFPTQPISETPEPGSLLLLGTGVIAMLAMLRRTHEPN